MYVKVNCSLQGEISLPIEARSIFRLLAIGTVVRYTPLIEYLNKNLTSLLSQIKQTPRLGHNGDGSTNEWANKDFLNYSEPGHTGGERTDFETCGEEELCKSKEAFFNQTFRDSIGRVFDYQVPLNSLQAAGEGVIDLISCKCEEGQNTIYVIEAKKWDSKEHPLRAMFEALTFWRLITDRGSPITDAKGKTFVDRYNKSKSKRGCDFSPPENATLMPAILIRGGEKDDQAVPSEPDGYIYSQLMNPSEQYKQLYLNILNNTKLKCFRYYRCGKKLEIKDFTEELKERCRDASKS